MKLLTNIGNEISEINLGRVKVGESKDFSFILFNEKGSRLENIKIKFDAVKDSEEINILKSPEKLGPKEKGTVTYKALARLN